MGSSDTGHRLLWHGFFLFLLGLLTGLAVPVLTNPRMGVSAHLEGVMNGLFLVALGLVWGRLTLSARQSSILFGLALYATYVNWLSTLLSAVWGTSKLTPIAGAGFTAQPWQEALVQAGLVSLSIAIIAACVLILIGLRRKPGSP